MTAKDDPDTEDGLLGLAAPLVIWAAHFLLCYGTAALYCAKVAGPGGALGPARWAILAYTAVALALVAWLGGRGQRRQRAASGAAQGPAGTSLARFMGFTTLLLACLSALAIIYGALVAAFVRSCR